MIYSCSQMASERLEDLDRSLEHTKLELQLQLDQHSSALADERDKSRSLETDLASKSEELHRLGLQFETDAKKHASELQNAEWRHEMEEKNFGEKLEAGKRFQEQAGKNEARWEARLQQEKARHSEVLRKFRDQRAAEARLVFQQKQQLNGRLRRLVGVVQDEGAGHGLLDEEASRWEGTKWQLYLRRNNSL